MDVFRRDDLKDLRTHAADQHVSIFIPAHRVRSEEDPIRWKNCLTEAERQLGERGVNTSQIRDLLGPAHDRVDDDDFWNHQSDGLAAFLAPGFARFYRVPVNFCERVLAGPRFHVRPLLPLLQRNHRFFVLALSEGAVRLFQGDGFTLDEVDLEGVPANLAEVLRFDEKLETSQVRTMPPTGAGTSPRGPGSTGIFHGHGVGHDDVKTDRLRYFQAVDRGLHEYLRKESAPLVLAGLPEHWSLYREANTYAQLLDEAIPGSPDRSRPQELHTKAWPIVQKARPDVARVDLDRYGHEAGINSGLASADPSEIIPAASLGRVEVLFLANDSAGDGLWGVWNGDGLARHAERTADSEDLLNLVASDTLGHDGEVHLLPKEQVPGGGPLAAVFRWKA